MILCFAIALYQLVDRWNYELILTFPIFPHNDVSWLTRLDGNRDDGNASTKSLPRGKLFSSLSLSFPFVFFLFGCSLPPLFPGLGLFSPLDTRHTCQHSLNTRATCLSLNGPRNLYFAEAYARLVKRGLPTRRNRLPAVFPFLYPRVASFFPLLFFLSPPRAHRRSNVASKPSTFPRIFLSNRSRSWKIFAKTKKLFEEQSDRSKRRSSNRSFVAFVHH